jgi:hypothetical protein
VHVAGNPPTGLWRLQLTRQQAEFSDPKGSGMTLTVKALSDTQVTFAPDLSCEARGGRQQDSVFRITKTTIGVRFSVIKASCPSDIAVLTSAEWRKASGSVPRAQRGDALPSPTLAGSHSLIAGTAARS